MSAQEEIETHPLAPFLPEGATVLMLGSFPPPRKRWSIEFYYPNMQNDMWRVMGLVFFGERDHFIAPDGKRFDDDGLRAFLEEKGIALSDTAHSVVRQRGNASDALLRVVEPVDLAGMLDRIPECRTIVTTGQKAAETLATITGTHVPALGGSACFDHSGRTVRICRMPSTSRAYPKPLAEKAEAYARMFREAGVLRDRGA